MIEQQDAPSPAEVEAFEAAVQAHVASLMAQAALKEAERAFWHNPTERGAWDFVRAKFRADDAARTALGAEDAWIALGQKQARSHTPGGASLLREPYAFRAEDVGAMVPFDIPGISDESFAPGWYTITGVES